MDIFNVIVQNIMGGYTEVWNTGRYTGSDTNLYIVALSMIAVMMVVRKIKM